MAFPSNEFLVVLYSYWTKCLIALWAIIGTLALSPSIKWKAFFLFCHWKKLRTCLGTPFSSTRRSILLIFFNSIFYQGFSLIVCSVCHVTSTAVLQASQYSEVPSQKKSSVFSFSQLISGDLTGSTHGRMCEWRTERHRNSTFALPLTLENSHKWALY